jgi:hypothetical protein
MYTVNRIFKVRKFCLYAAIFTILFISAACASNSAKPEAPASPPPDFKFKPSNVELPENYRTEFLHYATVDHSDAVIRNIYISPQAANDLQVGYSLPNQTIIVIEAYNAELDLDGEPLRDANGRYIKAEPLDMVHVAEKRFDWSESDFSGTVRAGSWNFGSYAYETGDLYDEDINACFNCHNATGNSDFIYTYSLLGRYKRSGETQYLYCDLPDRIAC